MKESVFSKKLLDYIKEDIIDTIKSKAISILWNKEETHYIELGGCIYINNGDLCETYISSVEVDETGEVLMIDNDGEIYYTDDGVLSLEVIGQIADALMDEEFDLVEKEED